MTGKPLGELVLVFDLDQVHGVLLVGLGQVRVCEVGEGSAALIQSTKGCLYRRIRAARLSMIVPPGIIRSRSRALVHAARAWYSRISPPRISRRLIASARAGPGPGIGRPTSCGRRRPSLRCGRCELWCGAYSPNTYDRCLRPRTNT